MNASAKKAYLEIYRLKSTTTLLAQLICEVKFIATILSHLYPDRLYPIDIQWYVQGKNLENIF